MKKICTKCKIEKDSSEFYSRKDAKDGLTSACKPCKPCLDPLLKKEYDKNHYLKNKEKKDSKAIDYYHKNKEKKSEYDKKNRSVVLKQRRERYKTDINYKLLCNLRSRLHVALKRNKRVSHTIDLLGCSIEELKSHIELKFSENMNWDEVKSGAIHIDHIIPCSFFDLSISEEQKKCFHYSNLQPLWAKDNFKKSNKLFYN